jgi:hypothetical protein
MLAIPNTIPTGSQQRLEGRSAEDSRASHRAEQGDSRAKEGVTSLNNQMSTRWNKVI